MLVMVLKKTARKFPALVAGLLLGVSCFPAGAEIYKWVDGVGNTQYTQSPPPPGIEGHLIQTPHAGNDKDKANQALEQRIRYLDGLRNQREERLREAGKRATETEQQRARCENAATRLESLQRPRVNLVDTGGERRRMNEDERVEQLNQAELYLLKYCR